MALAPGDGDQLVGQRAAQLVVGLEGPGEAEQLVLDLVERALGLGDLEQRRGVAVDAVDQLMTFAPEVAPTLAMKSSMRR